MIHTYSIPTGSPIESRKNAEALRPERSRPMAAARLASAQTSTRIVLSSSRLFELEGEEMPRDVQLLASSARAKFAFLPQPIEVAVAEDSLVIVHPRELANNCQEAARLVERALRRAVDGEQSRAVELCRRALELQPSLHVARETLARALVELGEADQAKTTLRQLLRVDPSDQWALSALVGLHGQAGDCQEGERLARLALAAAPDNPALLQTLATTLLQAGRFADAADTFRRVIEADPQTTLARLGLARALAQLQRPEESLLVLQDFFNHARVGSSQGDSLVKEARALCASVQGALARQQFDRARDVLSDLRTELEQSGGIPIRIGEEDSSLGSPAVTEIAWGGRATEHRIKIEKSFPDLLKPHLLAHELMHVRLETEARLVGKALVFTQSSEEFEHARRLFAGQRHELLCRGCDVEELEWGVCQVVRHILRALLNLPQDMVVEWNIHRDLPMLAPFQFEACRSVVERHQRPRPEDPLMKRLIPVRLRQLLNALNHASALAADDLFGGTTAYAARFEAKDGFELGQTLFGRFKDQLPTLGPEGHYLLVDDFADLMGLRGWYHWNPVHTWPHGAAGAQPTGIPSPEELAEMHPKECLNASSRLARMSREEASRLMKEIARCGLNGLEPHSMEPKHQLQAVPGETFAAPELICLASAGVRNLASMEPSGLRPDETAMGFVNE